MKIAYCGIDLFGGCLARLLADGHRVAEIFTLSTDPFDPIDQITAMAREHTIPLHTAPITAMDIARLEKAGVELMVIAGYGAKIPLSTLIRQVNIHPSLLPVGRGAWPMPVSILRGLPSGITLHKLTAGFDEGDILLQKALPLNKDDTLETLTAKLQRLAPVLLSRFLAEADALWADATPQSGGEYWPEPTDEDRTLTAADTCARAGLLLRAFAGYGVLYQDAEGRAAIPYGHVCSERPSKGYPLADGWLSTEQEHRKDVEGNA